MLTRARAEAGLRQVRPSGHQGAAAVQLDDEGAALTLTLTRTRTLTLFLTLTLTLTLTLVAGPALGGLLVAPRTADAVRVS